MVNTPILNHWWNVPLYVSATGLTTSLIPHSSGNSFQVDFDLRAHRLEIVTVFGGRRSIPLQSGPVADFYAEVMHHLIEHRFWRALVQMVRVFDHFRSRFVGKSSPVHLFWGGLDLATTRFSGRPAPPHPGGAPNCGPHVMLEAYSHEVSSLGYWPGGGAEGVFYSYAYPQPDGYKEATVHPPEASWNDEMQEFVLAYEHVRPADDPARMLLEFAQSTYEAAADTADWDRAHLERSADRGPHRESGTAAPI